MKISGSRSELPAIVFPKSLSAAPDSDLLTAKRKSSPRRKAKGHVFAAGGGPRFKRDGCAPPGRSRPETPLLKWKYNDGGDKDAALKEEKKSPTPPECGLKSRRKSRRAPDAAVSARKLAAGLWRLRPADGGGGSGGRLKGGDRLGFQPCVGHSGASLISLHGTHGYKFDATELMLSQVHSSGPKNGLVSKFGPSIQTSNSAMEGATKWDPVQSKTSDEVRRFCSHMNILDQQVSAGSVVSALESELRHARARIEELESEKRSFKKKMEHLMRKVNEEKASWRSREHEKIRAVIDDMKADLNRERKNRQRMELMNSKLVNELADAKYSAKRFMQDYEKERKARELIEEVCDELAKEIGEDKTEIDTLKRESGKLREEVEDERKMLQMAEVWREERVQMKLVDAKLALHEKYAQMNKLVADLKKFLMSRNAAPDEEVMREADLLLHAAASVNVQEIKEFSYEPPNSDDIFSVLEEVNFGESNGREIETCAAQSPASHASKPHTMGPDVNLLNRDSSQRHSNTFMDQDGDTEDDESGWETVSHPEDQGSSYSLEGSNLSFNNTRQNSNLSGSGTEWEENAGEETPVTEISEVCSVQTRQLKKSAISRFWKSCPNNGENYKIVSVEGMKGRLSNGKISNGSVISPDRGSVKGARSPSDFLGQWSSPDSANPSINRATKGCIEWPRSMQKGSLKAKLFEARIESQKIQLRHVLKQKI